MFRPNVLQENEKQQTGWRRRLDSPGRRAKFLPNIFNILMTPGVPMLYFSGQFDLLDRIRNWRSGLGASTAPNAILRTWGDRGDHRY